MKGLILIIGIFSFGLISCSNETFDNSLNGAWRVISFENLTTGVTEFKTQENSWGKDIKIEFNNFKNPKIISGTNITNQVYGEFNYIGQNRFKVTDFASTKVNQPSWADEFVIAILDQDLTFEITNNRLIIYYDNKSKSVTLTKD